MKKRSIGLAGILSILLLAVVVALLGKPAETAAAQSVGQYITVVVKEGECLATYTRIYGTSGAALLAMNRIKNPQIIYPGQVIVIPIIATFTPSLTTPFYYTIQPGDTLPAIARRFEMDVSTLANANGFPSYAAPAGQTILVPAGPRLYVVQKGDSIYSIAARYGVTKAFLLTGNNLPNADYLYAGQLIFIPMIYDAAPRPVPAPPTPMPTSTPTATPVPYTGPPVVATPVGTPYVWVWPTAVPTLPPTPTPAPNLTPIPGNYIQMMVREGDNLVTYTYRYGVSGGYIRMANPQLKDPDRIYAGQILTIPVLVSYTPSRTTPFFYVIVPGDNLYTMARQFEMNPLILDRANPGAAWLVGTTILVPAGPHVYTVKKGDELRYIAVRYGTTVEFLLTGNNLPNPDRIYEGQQLFVPIRYNAAPIPYN